MYNRQLIVKLAAYVILENWHMYAKPDSYVIIESVLLKLYINIFKEDLMSATQAI